MYYIKQALFCVHGVSRLCLDLSMRYTTRLIIGYLKIMIIMINNLLGAMSPPRCSKALPTVEVRSRLNTILKGVNKSIANQLLLLVDSVGEVIVIA